MATFKLSIEMGNDAMQDEQAVADAIRTVASRVENGQRDGGIRDANGNTVGKFSFSGGKNRRG